MAKASIKRLRGVAHNLAHHAQSGLSYLHPHLAEACKKAAIQSVSFDLLPESPYPSELASCEPLRLALVELREWFFGQLDHLGHDRSNLDHVFLAFEFRGADPYDSEVAAAIRTTTGKEYLGKVAFISRGPSNTSLTTLARRRLTP
jgi:hypothetical protein